MGELNLNLMNYQSHNLTGEFLDMMYSNTFFPLITRPTRITSHSATLIDKIFQNSLETNLLSSLLFTDISDHLPNLYFMIIYYYYYIILFFSLVIKIRKMCLNSMIP